MLFLQHRFTRIKMLLILILVNVSLNWINFLICLKGMIRISVQTCKNRKLKAFACLKLKKKLKKLYSVAYEIGIQLIYFASQEYVT